MKLQPKHHRSTASDSNLIPMINVVFLLLIFFMVAGNIRVSAPLTLVAPESTGDKPVIAQSVLFAASDGTLILNDALESMSTLKAALERLLAASVNQDEFPANTNMEPENRLKQKDQNAPQLAIYADAQLPISLLRDIMNSARRAGLSQVELLTTWIPADVR